MSGPSSVQIPAFSNSWRIQTFKSYSVIVFFWRILHRHILRAAEHLPDILAKFVLACIIQRLPRQRRQRPRLNLVHQLLRSSLRGNEVKPPSRSHPFGKIQDALRNRIAPAKIVEKPAVQLCRPQIALDTWNICTHRRIRSMDQKRINARTSRLVRQEIQNLLPCHAANLDSLHAASFAAKNINSRPGRFQKLRQQFDERLVCTVFHGWSSEPYL